MSSSLNRIKPMGDQKLHNKRIATNAKYDGVHSNVDTGSTVASVARDQQYDVSVKQGAHEKFKRMRPTALANFIEARIRHQAELESPDDMMQDFVIAPAKPPKNLLLLDVRDPDDYNACHIHGALSYPSRMINRSSNEFSADILFYKNRDNHLIVIYDLEEEIAVGQKMGNIWFEKGFDNVVIVSSGLREFVQTHAQLVSGVPPVPILKRNPAPRRAGPRVGGSQAGDSQSNASQAGVSMASSHKPKSLASSLARPSNSSGSWR
jgi:centrosomal protein CEP41